MENITVDNISERKLASIQIISDLKQIKDADNIEVATILGWTVVVSIGDFQVNDKCLYVETDSILPDLPPFDFLRNKKFRIKIRRFKGMYSYGIAFPLSVVDGLLGLEVGTNVTKLLGVTKHNPYIDDLCHTSGDVKGNFPSFLTKSDEKRIQTIPGIFTQYAGEEFSVTEKCDGTSFLCYYFNNEFGVCSHSLELKNTESNVYWQIAKQYSLENKLKQFYTDHNMYIAIQGEIVGSKVQGNPYKLAQGVRKLMVYNITQVFIDNGIASGRTNMSHYDMQHVCNELGLEMVPIIDMHYTLPNSVDAIVNLLEMANGKSLLNPNVNREGLVFRSNNHYGGRVCIINPDGVMVGLNKLGFKVVSPKYEDKLQ